MKNDWIREPNIPTFEKVLEIFKRSGGTEEMATSFYNKYEGLGWHIGSSPIINYVAIANNYIYNWRKNEENKRSVAGKNRGFQSGRANGEGGY